MALLDFLKPKKNKKRPRTAAEKAAARRARAFETGFVEHPGLESQFKRQKFLVKNYVLIKALIYVGLGLIILVIVGAIVLVIIQNLPGRDDDKDGVPNAQDICPGFDDHADDDKDGVPNGCEEQPDSVDLLVVDKKIIPAGTDRYDVMFTVRNPNEDWGASPLEYVIDLLDQEGSVINSSKRSQSYILPGQEKELVAFNILAVQKPIKPVLTVLKADWLKVQNYVKPKFDTKTLEFKMVDQPGVYAKLKGRTKNLTTFTFNNVAIVAVLRNKKGQVVALNRSEIDTLNPGEERDFIVTFPEQLPEVDLAKINYQTDVDVFNNDTFVQTSIVKGQKFQQFSPEAAP